MAKVLVIRKPDKTIHKVPLENKARLMAYNNRLPDGKKWKFEELEEGEAKKLPFIDESYVTAAEAQDKAQQLEKTVSEKDALIKELEEKLAALNKMPETTLTAEQLIEKINHAGSTSEVEKLLGDDQRVTVKNAATKRIASFTTGK